MKRIRGKRGKYLRKLGVEGHDKMTMVWGGWKGLTS